jgi:hypothetical protein
MSRSKLLGVFLAGALVLLPAVARADTRVTSANESNGTSTESGDATAHNSGTAQVGLQGEGGSSQVGSSTADESGSTNAADIASAQADNVQEGDNELDASQDANASSGNTIGGQVIGAVSDGILNVDATNLSQDVDNESGDADASNNFAAFVGLNASSGTILATDDDVISERARNLQVGDDSVSILQETDASTGDAIGGQVFGGRSGGPADIVLANTSDDAGTESGDAGELNNTESFTGLAASGVIELA